MTNTLKRVVSALVLAALILLSIYLGQVASLITIMILGILVLEELTVNFFEIRRFSWKYIVAQFFYTAPYCLFNFVWKQEGFFILLANAGFVLNIFLAMYLWSENYSLKSELKQMSMYYLLLALYVAIPIHSFAYLTHRPHWIILLIGLILINSVTDIGAWFWGKLLGRHPLWSSVSPNKTIEGFIGGVITSAVASCFYWHYQITSMNFVLVICLVFLAICAQVGDLIQSKVKREFGIKDSSNLIPGHGGVFDRIDSFLFVSPLYALVLMFLVNY